MKALFQRVSETLWLPAIIIASKGPPFQQNFMVGAQAL